LGSLGDIARRQIFIEDWSVYLRKNYTPERVKATTKRIVTLTPSIKGKRSKRTTTKKDCWGDLYFNLCAFLL
jgi:hypothetical protein